MGHNIEIENYDVHYDLNLHVSDHYPITYSIPINHKPTSFITSWSLARGNWAGFTADLELLYSNYSIADTADVDEIVDQFTKNVYDIAMDNLGFSEFNPKMKPWWTQQIGKQKEKIKNLHNKIHKMEQRKKKHNLTQTVDIDLQTTRNTTINDLRRQLKNEKHKYYRLIKDSKQQRKKSINKSIQNATDSSRQYWRLLSQTTTHKKKDIELLTYRGKNYTTTQTQVEILHEVNLHPPSKQYDDETHDFHNQIDEQIEDESYLYDDIPHNKWHYILTKQRAPYELEHAIKEIDPDKALGPDAIHNRFIKAFEDHTKQALLKIFNLVLNKGQFPKWWNCVNISRISKQGRNLTDPLNYLPIAVSSAIGRLFEKIISRRIQVFAVRNKIFTTQCGFQINRNTGDILTQITTDILMGMDDHLPTEAVFLDISKAYDSVWHNGLIHKLSYKYNFKDNFLSLIISFIKNRYTRVSLN